MKKHTFLLFLILLFVILFCMQVSAQMRIKILYGKDEVICDVPPVIVSDRTMVPLRAIFEAIGAEVAYESDSRKITATKGDKTVVLHIDSDIMHVNDEAVILDSPAFIKNDRTLVPVRACAESFDLNVEWIEDARIVKIKKGVWLLTKSVDSNGITHEKTYDERGNLLFDESTNITCTYDEMDNCLSRGAYWKEYDKYCNLIFVKVAYGNETTYTYDDNRRIVTESVKSRMSPVPVIYSYTYDDSGNLIRKDGSDGTWEIWKYDEQNRFLYREQSNGFWVSSTYDEKGNIIASDNERGEWTKWEYDTNGNAILQSDAHRTTTYFYDEQGNLIRAEQSDGVWAEYSYDEEGRKTKWQMADFSIKYTYDEHGNVIREENDDGYYTLYTYEYFLQ